jgi:hypothetical protein
MLQRDGSLKNRKGYPKAPVEKPKKKDTGTGKLEGVGLPQCPSMRIRELYRHGTADKRAALRKHYPEYAACLKSKEVTHIPKVPELPVENPSEDDTDKFDPDTGPPKYPGINIRRDYLYESAAVRARLRKNFPTYAWYFNSKKL